MTLILDGKKIQKKIADELRERVNKLKKTPTLVIFSLKPEPSSLLYIESKKEFGANVGCSVEHIELESSISFEGIGGKIKEKNEDPEVDGVMIQLPFGSSNRTSKLLDLIHPSKDVDGLSAGNLASLFRGEEKILPATTRGILEMLSFYNLSIEGKKAVIVGRSNLVGRPTAMAFINRDATVVVCHSKTRNLVEEVLSADLVVSATGVPGLISSEMMHSEQIVLDVGISVGEEGLVKGDVDFQSALKTTMAVSPVPGGLGPLTVASLFLNLVDIAEGKVGHRQRLEG